MEPTRYPLSEALLEVKRLYQGIISPYQEIIRRPPPYEYENVKYWPLRCEAISFEGRVARTLAYLASLILLVAFFHLTCSPQVARFEWGTIVYPPVVLAGSPFKVTIHLPGHNPEGSKNIWPQLMTLWVDEDCSRTPGETYQVHQKGNGPVFMPIPEASSPSERAHSSGEEGSARTAVPVFEYTGIAMGSGDFWISIRVFASKGGNNVFAPPCMPRSPCVLNLLESSGAIRVYVVDIPLPLFLIETATGAVRNFFMATFLVGLILPVLLLLPRELRGFKEMLINMLR